MKIGQLLFAAILGISTSTSACDRNPRVYTHSNVKPSEVKPWVIQGIQRCNLAQLEELQNPLWDPQSGKPSDSEFDSVTVTTFDIADYYAISFGFKKPFPDAPSVLCHLDKNSGALLFTEYFGSEPGNSKPIVKKKLSGYDLIQQEKVRAIESWSLSLTEVLEESPK